MMLQKGFLKGTNFDPYYTIKSLQNRIRFMFTMLNKQMSSVLRQINVIRLEKAANCVSNRAQYKAGSLEQTSVMIKLNIFRTLLIICYIQWLQLALSSLGLTYYRNKFTLKLKKHYIFVNLTENIDNFNVKLKTELSSLGYCSRFLLKINKLK